MIEHPVALNGDRFSLKESRFQPGRTVRDRSRRRTVDIVRVAAGAK